MGALDFRLLCSRFSNEGQSSILSDLRSNLTRRIAKVVRGRDGEVRIYSVPLSWWMLTWVVRMSWHTPPCSYTLFTGCFSMQLLDQGHHPYNSTGFSRTPFYFPLLNKDNQLFISHSVIYLCSNVWEHYFPY